MRFGPEKAFNRPRRFSSLQLLWYCGLIMGLLLAACQAAYPLASSPTIPAQLPPSSATTTVSPSPSLTLSVTSTRYILSGTLPVWQNYAAPTIAPATAIPPPTVAVDLPEDVQTLLLLGSNEDQPYEGATTGMALVLVNTRLAKVSLITIPGDLFVYIPGYTMQRISMAYPVGGLPLLFKTMQYNFGIRPDHWALVHPDDFQSFVNDLDGLDISVLAPLSDTCGSFPPGLAHMDGSQVFCFISIRQGSDEIDRNRRLQQVLRLLFLRMVQNGNLVRLPDLLATYLPSIRIDLTPDEILSQIPLALKLGDPQRVSYFQVGWDAVTFWQLPGQSKSSVLLPRPQALMSLLQQAVDAVGTPSPLTDLVTTLEYELTISPTPSITIAPSSTPSLTPTLFNSPTPLPPTPITITPTITLTPTISTTPTETPTETETMTLTP